MLSVAPESTWGSCVFFLSFHETLEEKPPRTGTDHLKAFWVPSGFISQPALLKNETKEAKLNINFCVYVFVCKGWGRGGRDEHFNHKRAAKLADPGTGQKANSALLLKEK